jgi:hypothetical protein
MAKLFMCKTCEETFFVLSLCKQIKKGAGLTTVRPKTHNAMQNYEEIWKDVPNYEGVYQVSNLGRVKSLKWGKERILKPRYDGYGYAQVGLCKGGERKDYKVHRLMMLAFVDASDLQVNHINGIKADNRLVNLEYCTASENTLHAYKIGLIPKGENHGRAKLTRACVERIKYGHQGMTQQAISEIYGVSAVQVHMIRSGKSWKHI